MKVKLTIEQVEELINKFLLIKSKRMNKIKRIKITDLKHSEWDDDNVYYGGITFYVDGDSFTREYSDRIYVFEIPDLIDDIRKYLGLDIRLTTKGVTINK